MRLKTYKMAMSILPKFLTLKWYFSRTIWRIEVGDGSFFCIFHALSFEPNFFFDRRFPLKALELIFIGPLGTKQICFAWANAEACSLHSRYNRKHFVCKHLYMIVVIASDDISQKVLGINMLKATKSSFVIVVSMSCDCNNHMKIRLNCFQISILLLKASLELSYPCLHSNCLGRCKVSTFKA